MEHFQKQCELLTQMVDEKKCTEAQGKEMCSVLLLEFELMKEISDIHFRNFYRPNPTWTPKAIGLGLSLLGSLVKMSSSIRDKKKEEESTLWAEFNALLNDKEKEKDKKKTV